MAEPDSRCLVSSSYGCKEAILESTRKLRRELAYAIAKLHGLQESVDLTVDDSNAKALATQVREQAGVCLKLLDSYQSSVPGRMWSDAERRCQPLREDLRRTEKLFRVTSGEWERRPERSSYFHPTGEWTWDDLYGPVDDPVDVDVEPRARHEWTWDDLYEPVDDPVDVDVQPRARHERTETHIVSYLDLSRRYIEAHNHLDLDGLMDLVDDDVEFKRAGDPPLNGKAAVRRQYEREWADHKSTMINIKELFDADQKVAIEIHVDTGPPSTVHYDGLIVHHWNGEGRLVRYQLYIDEVTSADYCWFA